MRLTKFNFQGRIKKQKKDLSVNLSKSFASSFLHFSTVRTPFLENICVAQNYNVHHCIIYIYIMMVIVESEDSCSFRSLGCPHFIEGTHSLLQ